MNAISKPQTHCLPSIVFDRLLADEQEGLDEARAHLTTCDSCRQHFETLKQAQEAIMDPASVAAGVDAIIEAYHLQENSENVVSFPKYKMAISGVLALAAAAAVVLVLNFGEFRGSDSTDEGPGASHVADGIRLKGSSASFRVFVVRQGQAQPLGGGDAVVPGDMLAFSVSVTRPSHVAIAGIGSTGDAYYLDYQQTAPWMVEPGEPFQLPVSAQVDAQPGNERVFAFFCERPIDSSAAIDAIEQLYPADNTGHRTVAIEQLPSLSGCDTKSVLVRRNH